MSNTKMFKPNNIIIAALFISLSVVLSTVLEIIIFPNSVLCFKNNSNVLGKSTIDGILMEPDDYAEVKNNTSEIADVKGETKDLSREIDDLEDRIEDLENQSNINTTILSENKNSLQLVSTITSIIEKIAIPVIVYILGVVTQKWFESRKKHK